MPVTRWPEYLPQKFLRSSYNESMGDGRLRSKMDLGPEKIRRRSSNAPARLTVSIRMTAEQVLSMRLFIDTTLGGGSLPFTIPDPIGNITHGFRAMVRLTDMPSWTAVSDRLFDVELPLESLALVAAEPPTFDTAAMPPAREGVAYSWTPRVIEGSRPFQDFSISAGSLPSGLTIDSATGRISGTAPDFGTFNFTLRVTDASGRTATVARTLVVRPPGFIFAGEGADRIILDPTFTRASSGTVWGRDGVMRTVGNNVPRFDYDPVTGAFRGVLMEEARTNLLLGSSAIGGSGWNALQADVTIDAARAPDGTMMATLINFTGTGTSRVFRATGTPVIGETRAKSCWLWAAVAGTRVRLAGYDNGSYIFGPIIELTTVPTRYEFVPPAHTAATVTYFAIIQAESSSPATGVYAWGAQDEIGTFPTSYIPTTSAAATRAAEAMTVATGAWLNPSESTVIFEGDTNRTLTVLAVDRATMFYFNGSSQNSFEAFFSQSGAFQIVGSGGTLGGAGRLGPSPVPGQRTKVGLTYGGGGVAGVVDGGDVAEIASGRPAPLDIVSVFVGYRGGSGRHLNGHVRSLTYLPRRVSATEMQAATR